MVTKTILGRFLDHPARHWAIIAAIIGLGLTTVLPAADELSRSRQDRAELVELAARMRREAADLEEVRRKTKEEQEHLEKLEALAVTSDQVPLFRQEIVEWARTAGCQVRRTRLEPARSQQWQEGDSLFESTSANRANPNSSYVLQMQPLSLSVSGTLPKVKRLLTQLHSTERLIHCENLTVSTSSDNREEVVLNVELTLFDLAKVEVEG